MSFVRLFVDSVTREVLHVMEQDVPFSDGAGIRVSDRSLEIVDLGFAEQMQWTDKRGARCSPSTHFFARLGHKTEEEALAIATKGAEMPPMHKCPCSLSGIKQQLREKGPPGIPVKVRAWLANVLPSDQVSAMGIGRGLPISVMKAAEALRNKRDPNGGSRMFVLERKAQQQADAIARVRHEKRLKKVKGKP